jgi:folylpolyglutamate synthase/dihydropteroate synthase
MIRALGEGVAHVVACAPNDPQALSTAVVSAAAGRVVGDDNVTVASSVAEALKVAVERADPSEGVVIAGSLYVAGEARVAMGLA